MDYRLLYKTLYIKLHNIFMLQTYRKIIVRLDTWANISYSWDSSPLNILLQFLTFLHQLFYILSRLMTHSKDTPLVCFIRPQHARLSGVIRLRNNTCFRTRIYFSRISVFILFQTVLIELPRSLQWKKLFASSIAWKLDSDGTADASRRSTQIFG